MYEIDLREISRSPVRLIGDEWMLVTAGTPEKFNTMTASWGGLGFLWNKPVAFVFIRPQRYTFEFAEAQEGMTLSFFETKYRPMLTLCGSTSGRQIDKVAQSGLTPWTTPAGLVAFEEASLVLEGSKLYAQRLDEKSFLDSSLPVQWYKAGDFHQLYIVEITHTWKNG